MLDNFFKLKENGTNFKTEIIAGITTFLAMAYILGVNPSMLAEGGMPATGVFFATALSSGIAWGFVVYALATIAAGKIKEMNWGILVLAIVFIIYLFFGL